MSPKKAITAPKKVEVSETPEEPKKRSKGKRPAVDSSPTPKAKAKSNPAQKDEAKDKTTLVEDIEQLMDDIHATESAAAPMSSTSKASVTRTIVPKGCDQPVKQTMTDIFAKTRQTSHDQKQTAEPKATVSVPVQDTFEPAVVPTIPSDDTNIQTQANETMMTEGKEKEKVTEEKKKNEEKETHGDTIAMAETQIDQIIEPIGNPETLMPPPIPKSLANAIEIVKNHNLFNEFMEFMRDANDVDIDNWTFGEPAGDPLEDLRMFNQYAIEHWETPIPFEYEGHDEGLAFFPKSTDQETADALLVAARQHSGFQTYSETVIKDTYTFGTPAKDAVLHINLFNKYLQECSLMPVNLPTSTAQQTYSTEELFGNDDDMGVNTKTDEIQVQDSDDDDDDDQTNGFKYPVAPTAGHPTLRRLLQSAAKIMLKQLIAKGTVNVESKIRSLPRTFNLGDFYSGAGTFFLVVEAVVKAFHVVAPNPAEDLEMVHQLMSEWIPFKQRHLETLLSALGEDGQCCIFADATKVFGDDRECIRHQACCDIPSDLHGFNGGFSCRSFSRLHPDFASLKRALYNDDEEASSVSTFKPCVAALRHCQPDFYILENVELGDGEDPESNPRLIAEALEDAGYSTRLFRIMASDFGVPQRRLRVYIAGFSKAKQPQASLVRVEHAVNAMRLQCQRPEDFMLPDDHPAVLAELERRSNIRAKANVKDSKDTGETTVIGSKRGGGKKAKESSGKNKGIEDTSDSGKWQLAHQQLAESRGINWPLAVPEDLQGNAWFGTLSLREKENMLFLLNERQTLVSTGHDPIRYGDLQQSAHRTPTSTAAEVPTILPSSKLMDLERRRLLIGRELLHLQGIQFDPEVRDRLSESQMSDPAGNAFASTSCMAIFIAMILELEFRTESESDEEGEVLNLVEKLARQGQNLDYN